MAVSVQPIIGLTITEDLTINAISQDSIYQVDAAQINVNLATKSADLTTDLKDQIIYSGTTINYVAKITNTTDVSTGSDATLETMILTLPKSAIINTKAVTIKFLNCKVYHGATEGSETEITTVSENNGVITVTAFPADTKAAKGSVYYVRFKGVLDYIIAA